MNQNNINFYLNKVFNTDIFELLEKLPENSIDCIFGDPDYNVGIKYGDKTYSKSFNEYVEWYIELAKKSLRVLKNTGNMFLVNYPKQNSYLRVRYLDDACYNVHDYAWIYNTNVGHSPKRLTTAHRSILHCLKTKHNKFYKEHIAEPYKNPTDKRIKNNLLNGSKGRMPYSWLYYNLVKNVSKEKTVHACQIPQNLSELLIKSCTKPISDNVLILFGGSGAEIEICKKLKRNFISAEIDKKYYDMIIDRLNKGIIDKKYKLQFRSNGKQDVNTSFDLPLFAK